LVLGVDELSTNTTFMKTLSHKVISYSNVFAALMEDKVLLQSESRLVVHPQLHWLGLLPPKISEKSCQP
jgi:hypothetical protein